MKEKIQHLAIYFGEGLTGYIIGVTLYDRMVGLGFAFLAGLLGYLGKIAGEYIKRRFEEWKHGKND